MHAEVTRIQYDAAVISFRELLGVSFEIHNPLTKNRQGGDIGTQYRSVIFYVNNAELAEAQEAVKQEARRRGRRKLATTLEPRSSYFRAEGYHQAYLANGGQCDAKGDTSRIRCYG